MPKEIRQIILDNAELAEAIHCFRRVQSDLLPPGNILSVKPTEKGGASVKIEMKFGPNVRKDWFILEAEHLAEAMVRFCIENNIIVPLQGTRKVLAADRAWVLEIRLQGAEMSFIAISGTPEKAAGVASGMKVVGS
jgi:hypothetical protein